MANMAEALARSGHLVTVLSSQNDAEGIAASSDNEPADQDHNPKLIRLPYNGLRMVGTAQYMWGLNSWLNRHRPDLVYVSMLKHDAYVAVRAGQKLGIPVVLRPEGAGLTGDLAWQKRGRFGAVIGRKTRQANGLVALSETIERELLEDGYDAQRIHLIANGVPVPAEPWSNDKAMVARHVVFVGRLAQEKGLDTLLNSWPEVLKSFSGLQLRLIGDGPMRTVLEQQSDRLGITKSVQFAGALTDAAEQIRKASLFVLPSREEGLSIALLEAMAMGLPVVASNIPGNRILVKPGMTGRLALPDQALMLSEMIIQAFANQELTLRMAQAGRALVQTSYSIEAVAQRHLELFRRMIDETPR